MYFLPPYRSSSPVFHSGRRVPPASPFLSSHHLSIAGFLSFPWCQAPGFGDHFSDGSRTENRTQTNVRPLFFLSFTTSVPLPKRLLFSDRIETFLFPKMDVSRIPSFFPSFSSTSFPSLFWSGGSPVPSAYRALGMALNPGVPFFFPSVSKFFNLNFFFLLMHPTKDAPLRMVTAPGLRGTGTL